VREADDTQGIHTKSTRAISSKQTLSKAAIFIGEWQQQPLERLSLRAINSNSERRSTHKEQPCSLSHSNRQQLWSADMRVNTIGLLWLYIGCRRRRTPLSVNRIHVVIPKLNCLPFQSLLLTGSSLATTIVVIKCTAIGIRWLCLWWLCKQQAPLWTWDGIPVIFGGSRTSSSYLHTTCWRQVLISPPLSTVVASTGTADLRVNDVGLWWLVRKQQAPSWKWERREFPLIFDGGSRISYLSFKACPWQILLHHCQVLLAAVRIRIIILHSLRDKGTAVGRGPLSELKVITAFKVADHENNDWFDRL
jgi:hypothetical protein